MRVAAAVVLVEWGSALQLAPQQAALRESRVPLRATTQHRAEAIVSGHLDEAALAARWAAHGIAYVESFLAPESFAELESLALNYLPELSPETDNGVARGRLGTFVDGGEAFAQLLTSTAVRDCLKRITRSSTLAPSDFPVELRRYPRHSRMDWHTDEMLYSEPQVECVFTVLNTSDSETQWVEDNGLVVSQSTRPNSLLLVRAEGPRHRVTPVTKGDRVIAKFVYTDSPFKLDAWYANLDAYRPPQRR